MSEKSSIRFNLQKGGIIVVPLPKPSLQIKD